jgi:solute carrier family 25 (mitochondrial S-adenosylmethionine transporter), member 26
LTTALVVLLAAASWQRPLLYRNWGCLVDAGRPHWSNRSSTVTSSSTSPSIRQRQSPPDQHHLQGPTSTVVAKCSSRRRRVSAVDCIKTALAGGIAGAVGTATLYPLDAAKTVRQASPHTYRSVRAALTHLITTHTVYRGAWTAILGAIPSSALYFGAYETAKRCLLAAHYQQTRYSTQYADDEDDRARANYRNNDDMNFGQRLLLHASAAASGNLVSSAVFVPKELIKQRLQYCSSDPTCTWLTVIADILRDKGVKGLYTGYVATVLRNVPSAALRFGLYEELKRSWTAKDESTTTPLLHWRLFAAGAVAGALASGIMTPVDVLKTRLSTGTCPVDLPGCMQYIVKADGWSALFAGAGSRMATSAAFTSIGFGTFEAAKRLLRIPPLEMTTMRDPPPRGPTRKSTGSKVELSFLHHDHHLRYHCPRPLPDSEYRCCRLANLRLYSSPNHPGAAGSILVPATIMTSAISYC